MLKLEIFQFFITKILLKILLNGISQPLNFYLI